jgi:hypothetical protein
MSTTRLVARQNSGSDRNCRGSGLVADVVLGAARAARPKLRYTSSPLANRLRLLRRFAPAGLVDAGIRKDLKIDSLMASPSRPILAK